MSEGAELVGLKYNNYYENHQLAGTLDVYLPLIKMDLMMEYTCKAPISKLEQYVCRCIKQGMTDRYGVIDALALEDDMVNSLINNLIAEEIVKEEAGKLTLTRYFLDESETIKCYQQKKTPVTWCYKGLMNADKKIDTHIKGLEDTFTIQEVLEGKQSFYLLPNIVIEVKHEELKALNPKMLYYPNAKEEEILEVQGLEIIKARSVIYLPYRILFFKGVEGDVKVLVHHIGDNEKIDKAFTRTIQRLYDRSELWAQMRYTMEDGETQIINLTKNMKRV